MKFTYVGELSKKDYWFRMLLLCVSVAIPLCIIIFYLWVGDPFIVVFYIVPVVFIYYLVLGLRFFKTLAQRVRTVGHSVNSLVFLIVPLVMIFLFSAFFLVPSVLLKVILFFLILLFPAALAIYYGLIDKKENAIPVSAGLDIV